MPKTTAPTAVKNRYNAKAYDQLPIRVPKGCKAVIQATAAQAGQSLNALLRKL